MSLPTGTVTFLFTDIEGSTRLWERSPDAMRPALLQHDEILRRSIDGSGGHVFKTVGDAFCAAFATALEAVAAALIAQQALLAEAWNQNVPLRVRMGLHTGTTEQRDGDYFGTTLNRTARLVSVGHGGQVLLSAATQELIRDHLPSDTSLRGLGEARLRDLGRPEQVFQLAHPALPAEFPPLRSLDSPDLPNNLPRQLTSFIGREKELGEVKQRLAAATGLLTLTGSGGCGKTRLALQTAADVLEQYPDGVWLIELAPVGDPALVPQTVLAALGLHEEAGKPAAQSLREYLRPRRPLLVLDNCEHLLSACAELAEALLRSCSTLKILASSRESLGVAGESVYRIPSLSLPDPKHAPPAESLWQYDAVRLFTERAAAVTEHFQVTAQNASALAQVCQRLDGIPLAIELAAARVRAMPVEQVAARLDDRFRLLTGGSRTALPRQQTLRALIDWSYDLLTAPEKTLLRRLSVFAGGWNLEAAEAVCPGESIEEWDVLDLLTELVDKSLVVYQEEEARFRLLETVRQYARDRLVESGEADAARNRHLDFFLLLAETTALRLKGAEQVAGFDLLESEHDNLRAALEYATSEGNSGQEEAPVQKALQLGVALSWFWFVRGYGHEGRERLEAVLARADASAPTRAAALVAAGICAVGQNDFKTALPLLEEGLTVARAADDQHAAADALFWQGHIIALQQGDQTKGRPLLEESLALYRQVGDQWGIAHALANLGDAARFRADWAVARALYEEAFVIQQALQDKRSLSWSWHNLGRLAWKENDYAKARELTEKSLVIRKEVGDSHGTRIGLMQLGRMAAQYDDLATARAAYQQLLALKQGVEEWSPIVLALYGLAEAALSEGHWEEARQYYDDMLAFTRKEMDTPEQAYVWTMLGETARMLGDYRAARLHYEEALRRLRQSGIRGGIIQNLLNLGFVNVFDGRLEEARACFTESLPIMQEAGYKRGVALYLIGMAGVAGGQQQWERAARMLGAAEAALKTLGTFLEATDRPEYDRYLSQTHAALSEDAFAAAWAEGQAMPLEQATGYAQIADAA